MSEPKPVTNPTAKLLLKRLPLETENDTGGVTPAHLAEVLSINLGTIGSTLIFLLDRGYVKRERNPNNDKGYIWWKNKEVRKPKLKRKKLKRPVGIVRKVKEIHLTPDTEPDIETDFAEVFQSLIQEHAKYRETLKLIAECIRDAGIKI